MENFRYNISPCSEQEAGCFIEKIDEAVYVPRSIVKADERSHYDRYTYTRNDSKVAIVYDTFAHVISITASKAFADELLSLFAADASKTVKTSTVPAQGSAQAVKQDRARTDDTETVAGGKRSKLFVSPETIRRPTPNVTPITVFATSKGAEISTDEIYPPQRARKRTPAPQSQTFGGATAYAEPASARTEHNGSQDKNIGVNISAGTSRVGQPRRATISFGDEDYNDGRAGAKHSAARPSGTGIFADIATAPVPQPEQASEPPVQKRGRGRPPKTDRQQQNEPAPQQPATVAEQQQGARKRGRPPKSAQQQQPQTNAPIVQQQPRAPEPAECAIPFSRRNMSDFVARLKRFTMSPDLSVADAIAYIVVSAKTGERVRVAYFESKSTLKITGVNNEFYRMTKDCAEKIHAKDPVIATAPRTEQPQVIVETLTEPMRRLYRRIPTAFTYLADSARNYFAGAFSDFSQPHLDISDYSGLLIQPFRALEKFIFDIQHAKGIQVKMIGQAYDKDERGRYILKRGYQQRINSVVYAEVVVSLYVEYFTQRNFIVHTDNSDSELNRALPEFAAAKKIFDRLLDVVEYNARKLKEIGFVMGTDN